MHSLFKSVLTPRAPPQTHPWVCTILTHHSFLGGFGVDFSDPVSGPEGVEKVAKQLPQHGVTSFVPTLITSQTETYKSVSVMKNETTDVRTCTTQTRIVNFKGTH